MSNDSKNEVESLQPSLEIQLSAKQLEIELLLLLWRYKFEKMNYFQ